MEIIKEGCLKGIPQEFIVEMFDMPPEKGITNAPFRNETVDMRVPFKISAKGVKDADEPGSKTFRFVDFMEHTGNNTVNRGEKAVKEGTVHEEKRAQFVSDGKHTMTMLHRDNLKRHGSSPVNRVHVAAGRTETGMAAKGNKFKVATGRAGIHGTTKGRITAMNHFFYIPGDRIARMLKINHFFKMVSKNFL